mmetsp:Transcript_126056/g.177855  ORF Transcript_126056/g.177855 Transcript_126056/m.177855 type:complete len:136 (-) Transcript_126056:217-624(-)
MTERLVEGAVGAAPAQPLGGTVGDRTCSVLCPAGSPGSAIVLLITSLRLLLRPPVRPLWSRSFRERLCRLALSLEDDKDGSVAAAWKLPWGGHHAWRGWLEKGVANALLPPMPQDGEAGRTGGPAIWCNAGCANG